MTSASDKTIARSLQNPARPSRLLGLDLLRGAAVIGVILLHADEWNGIEQLPAGWLSWVALSLFAVPFFLAASFYLAVSKFIEQPERPFSLGPRLRRLLIPYVVWSGIYLLYKIARYGLLGDWDVLRSITSDPILIIFVGGAGFHLYFLPLLMTGTVLLKSLSGSVKYKLKGITGLIFFILSLSLYELVIQTGNTVDVSSGSAFNGWLESALTTNNLLLRPVLVYLAWAIRCLPYIAFAFVIYPILTKQVNLLRSWSVFVVIALSFLMLNLYGSTILPLGLFEVFQGYMGVILAITLSSHLSSHPIIKSLGRCSFGIYLCHLLFLEVFQTVWIRVSPETARNPSIILLFGIIGLTFLLSWGLTQWLIQRRILAPWLFGMPST